MINANTELSEVTCRVQVRLSCLYTGKLYTLYSIPLLESQTLITVSALLEGLNIMSGIDRLCSPMAAARMLPSRFVLLPSGYRPRVYCHITALPET